MERQKNGDSREPEIVYSRTVKAGKRIYYLDVKKARNEDLYLCITESKRKQNETDGSPIQLEKHRLFLYKEDFARFAEELKDVMSFVERHFGEIEERPVFEHREEGEKGISPEDKVEDSENIDKAEQPEEKRGFFARLISK